MHYSGHVRNGAIVLDDPMELPEGKAVRIEFDEETIDADGESGPTFSERYAEICGMARSLPVDAAENHDHYLYDTPKR